MSDRDVHVKISGSETVSGAAAQSESALGAFLGKAKVWLAGLGVIAAGAALGKFFTAAIQEAAGAEEATRRLSLAVRNAGASFTEWRPEIDATISRLARMTTFSDDEFSEALARMVTITGSVPTALKALGLAADVAAYSSKGLADSGEAVARAMLGNSRQLKEFGIETKDGAEAIADLSRKLGGSAVDAAGTFNGALARLKNQWGEFQEAVGQALLGQDNWKGGTEGMIDLLVQLENWVRANEDGIAAFAEGLRNSVTGVLQWVADTKEKLDSWADTWHGRLAAHFMSLMTEARLSNLGMERDWKKHTEAKTKELAAWQQTFFTGAEALTAAEVRELQARTRAAKEEAEKRAKEEAEDAEKRKRTLEKANAETAKLMRQLFDAAAETVKQNFGKQVQEQKDALKALHEQLGLALGPTAKAMIEDTSVSLDGMVAMARELARQGKLSAGELERIEAAYQQQKTSLADMLPPAQQMAEWARQAREDNERLADAEQRRHLQMIENVTTAARAALDFGGAFGIVDEKAQAVLNSVINIGDNLGKLFAEGFSTGGLIGVIGGLANAIGGLIDNPAQKAMRAALAQNRAALDRLTKEVGNLNLDISGEDLIGIQGAIDATAAAEAAGQFGKGPQGDIKAFMFFMDQLSRLGLSPKAALEFLSSLGFDVSNPAKFRQGLPLVRAGLGTVADGSFGRFGQDFASQFDFITQGFDIFGIEDPTTKLLQYQGLADRFSPAIAAALRASDPRAALRDLYHKLGTGELTPADFGSLTGSQFLQFLQTLLPLFAAGGVIPPTGGPFPGDEGEASGSAASGPFGSQPAIAVDDVTFEGGIHVTLALDTEGRPVGEVAEDLATIISRAIYRNLADRAASQGVPV